MKSNYESQGRGPEKYSIYNEYMKVFLPVAFSGDQGKRDELSKSLKKNEQLRKRVEEMRNNKQGCCSSCSMM